MAILSLASIQAMIDRDSEGLRLEFKEDIPLSSQNQAEQRKQGISIPKDSWWAGGKVADSGRDKLVEEIVAFANAQGGTLIIGMEEHPDTTVAKAVSPLPRANDLSSRMRDFILELVEPRLPYFHVQAIESDNVGNGIVVVQVEPSRLGPHWVKSTRNATVRRGDKCLNLAMPEIHNMVIRNARSFEEVSTRLNLTTAERADNFLRFLINRVKGPMLEHFPENDIETWLRNTGQSAYAIIISMAAHDDIGITRVGDFLKFVPPQQCIVEHLPQGQINHPGSDVFWPQHEMGTRFLGGVAQLREWTTGLANFSIERTGLVTHSVFHVVPVDHATLTPAILIGQIGACLGMFDKLRISVDRGTLPAEASVTVLTFGQIMIAVSQEMARFAVGKLPQKSHFGRFTLSRPEDFTTFLNQIAQDLLDAGNVRGHPMPRFSYDPL